MRHLVACCQGLLLLGAASLALAQEGATTTPLPPTPAPAAPVAVPPEGAGPAAVAIVASGADDVPELVLDQVRQAAMEVVRSDQARHGREARAERDPGLVLRASGCGDDACLVAVGRDAAAAYLLLFMVERQAVGGRSTVLLVDVGREQTVGSAAFDLPAEAAQFAEAMTAPLGPLLAAIVSIYPQTGTLVVTVDQAGAAVSIDGEAVGASPLEPREEVEPGEHRVRVELAGFLPFEQPIQVVAGETATLAATLEVEPAPPPPPPPPTPVWRRWWFWTAIGTVVVGTGLGLGLGFGIDTTPELRQVQEGVSFPGWEQR